MRLFFVVLTTLAIGTARADFDAGLRHYERGDFAAALAPIAAAASAGDADAQFIFGRMYAHGDGVPNDPIEAFKWFSLAADQGHRLAPISRDVLTESMSEAQIATAQRRAGQGLDDERTASATDDEPSETLVAQIQLNLKRLGYTIGSINGQLDDRTREAVQAYRADNELPEGAIDRKLLAHMSANQGSGPTIRRGEPEVQSRPTPNTSVPNTEESPSFRKLL